MLLTSLTTYVIIWPE